MDQVFDGNNTVLSQSLFNDRVVVQGNSLLVDLTETSLVDQFSNSRERWVSENNIRINQLQQLQGSLGELDESGSVDLVQSQQLKDLSWLRWNLVHTLNSDNENEFGLSWNVVFTCSLGVSSSLDNGIFGILILLVVSFSSLEDSGSLLLVSLKKLYVSNDFDNFANLLSLFSLLCCQSKDGVITDSIANFLASR